MRTLAKRSVLLAVSLILVLASGAAVATPMTMFYDDFESYGTHSVTNWTPPSTSPWTVSDGTIDLIETPDWGLLPAPSGGLHFLDMDGSSYNAGMLMSINLSTLSHVSGVTPGPFRNLVSGQEYVLSFWMGGSQRKGSPANTEQIGISSVDPGGSQRDLMAPITLSYGQSWREYTTASFVYNYGDRIFFNDVGIDNIGVLLDNVEISAVSPAGVPEPISMVMLGCVGAGMFAARKLRGKGGQIGY